MSNEERSVEIREKPNSIEIDRNAKGEWSVKTKIYFGPTQEDAEEAKEWLDEINLRLLVSYPPVEEVQADVLRAKLEHSVFAVRTRNAN